MLSDSSINTLIIEEYFVDTGDSDVPWSFNSTRWMMDGVKIYNDLVYVDVEYDHDGVEYDYDGEQRNILIPKVRHWISSSNRSNDDGDNSKRQTQICLFKHVRTCSDVF